LKLEGQNIKPCGATLAAPCDGFLDEQPTDRKVDRPYEHEPPRALSVKESILRQ